MKFEKGTSGNSAGRPKGTPNRLAGELRAQLKGIVEGELEQLPVYLEKLSEQDRLQVLLKLLPYVLPKVQAVIMEKGEPLDSMDWLSI